MGGPRGRARSRARSRSIDAVSSDGGGADATVEMEEVSVPNDALYRELDASNAYFDALVDMLPAKMYVPGPTGDEMYSPKYRKGQHKESKEVRKARNKAAKRDKFARAETTLQTKKRVDNEELSDGESDDDNFKVQDAHEEEEDGAPLEGWGGPAKEKPVPSTANASRIEALRARLRAKIAERQGNRPAGDNSERVSKRAARRAEKRKREEEAKKRKAEQGGAGAAGGGKSNAHKSGGAVRVQMGGTKLDANATGDAGRKKDLAGVDFGSIAGLTKQTPYYLDNKSLSSAGKKKSLDRLLADAEKKAERLRQLKASSDQGDKDKAKAIEWGDTLREATGQRVRDDPALIKKAMKRKAAKKKQSSLAWKARLEHTKDKMDERQKIRSHNLDTRKKGGAEGANLSKKRIKDDEEKEGKKRPRLGPHSGKARAGFEGRKSDFINGGKGGNGGKEGVNTGMGGEKAATQ